MPLSPPDLDYNPYAIPPEYLKAIGLVAAASAQTERAIELAIGACLGVQTQYQAAVTTHKSGPQRDHLLRAVAELRIDNVDMLDELDVILDEITKSVKKRHSAVHNQWGYSPSENTVYTAQVTARGSVRGDITPMKLDEIEADAKAIYEAGMALIRFLIKYDLRPDIGPYEPRHHRLKEVRKKRKKHRANTSEG